MSTDTKSITRSRFARDVRALRTSDARLSKLDTGTAEALASRMLDRFDQLAHVVLIDSPDWIKKETEALAWDELSARMDEVRSAYRGKLTADKRADDDARLSALADLLSATRQGKRSAERSARIERAEAIGLAALAAGEALTLADVLQRAREASPAPKPNGTQKARRAASVVK